MDLVELFESAGLPADFSQKAKVLFDTSLSEQVDLKVAEQTKTLQESFDKKLDESKNEFIEEQSKQIESLAESVVVEWIENNVATLDNKVKTEVLESIVTKLKESFESIGVVTPDETSAALIESVSAKAQTAETKLDEVTKELKEAKDKLDKIEKADIVAELTEGLSEVSTERVLKLSESLKTQDIESFRKSVEVLAEAFGAKPKVEPDTKPDPDENDGKGDPGVDNAKTTEPDGDEGKGKDKTTNESTTVDPLIAATMRLLNGNKE